MTISLSLSRKINLGNYESADVFISISGVTEDTTQEEMNTLLDVQGALAYSALRTRLNEQVKLARPA